MGKLIKNHLARLITLSAALYAFAASIHGIFWPKIFFDFTTLNLDAAVKPFPILQIINAVLSLLVLAFEWPVSFLVSRIQRERRAKARANAQGHDGSGGSSSGATVGFWGALHQNIEFRLFSYPALATSVALLYQGTNAALYFVIAVCVWFWAYCEGEIVCAEPWTLPPRKGEKGRV